MRIPTDMFQLHVVTLVYIGRVATLMAVMHLAGVALLSAAGNARWLKFKPRRITLFAGGSFAILLLSIGLMRLTLFNTVDQAYSKDEVVGAMQVIKYPSDGKVHLQASSDLLAATEGSGLKAIRERGSLRVGYDRDGLPFSYISEQGNQVGLDIEMTQAFADELDVEVEYFPYNKAKMQECLNDTLYSHWIEGKTAQVNERRWNVLDDVLGWSDTNTSKDQGGVANERVARLPD